MLDLLSSLKKIELDVPVRSWANEEHRVINVREFALELIQLERALMVEMSNSEDMASFYNIEKDFLENIWEGVQLQMWQEAMRMAEANHQQSQGGLDQTHSNPEKGGAQDYHAVVDVLWNLTETQKEQLIRQTAMSWMKKFKAVPKAAVQTQASQMTTMAYFGDDEFLQLIQEDMEAKKRPDFEKQRQAFVNHMATLKMSHVGDMEFFNYMIHRYMNHQQQDEKDTDYSVFNGDDGPMKVRKLSCYLDMPSMRDSLKQKSEMRGIQISNLSEVIAWMSSLEDQLAQRVAKKYPHMIAGPNGHETWFKTLKYSRENLLSKMLRRHSHKEWGGSPQIDEGSAQTVPESQHKTPSFPSNELLQPWWPEPSKSSKSPYQAEALKPLHIHCDEKELAYELEILWDRFEKAGHQPSVSSSLTHLPSLQVRQSISTHHWVMEGALQGLFEDRSLRKQESLMRQASLKKNTEGHTAPVIPSWDDSVEESLRLLSYWPTNLPNRFGQPQAYVTEQPIVSDIAEILGQPAAQIKSHGKDWLGQHSKMQRAKEVQSLLSEFNVLERALSGSFEEGQEVVPILFLNLLKRLEHCSLEVLKANPEGYKKTRFEDAHLNQVLFTRLTDLWQDLFMKVCLDSRASLSILNAFLNVDETIRSNLVADFLPSSMLSRMISASDEGLQDDKIRWLLLKWDGWSETLNLQIPPKEDVSGGKSLMLEYLKADHPHFEVLILEALVKNTKPVKCQKLLMALHLGQSEWDPKAWKQHPRHEKKVQQLTDRLMESLSLSEQSEVLLSIPFHQVPQPLKSYQTISSGMHKPNRRRHTLEMFEKTIMSLGQGSTVNSWAIESNEMERLTKELAASLWFEIKTNHLQQDAYEVFIEGTSPNRQPLDHRLQNRDGLKGMVEHGFNLMAKASNMPNFGLDDQKTFITSFLGWKWHALMVEAGTRREHKYELFECSLSRVADNRSLISNDWKAAWDHWHQDILKNPEDRAKVEEIRDKRETQQRLDALKKNLKANRVVINAEKERLAKKANEKEERWKKKLW